MTTQLQQAYERIPVPAGLEKDLLSACLAVKKPSATRYWVPAASMVACAGVLLVSLAATGRLDGWLTRVENWVVGPDEEIFLEKPDSTPPTTVTTPTGSTITLSTTPTTATPATTVAKSTTVSAQTTVIKNTTGSPSTTVAPATTVTSPAVSGAPLACMRSLPGDYASMTLPELKSHFGCRIQPAWLPEDMKLQQTSIGYGVWYRNEEKMKNLTDWEKKQFEQGIWRDEEVIYDQNAIHYQGKDNRTLSVAMSTAPYPRNLLGDMSRFDEAITVAGVAATLAYYDDSPYVGNESYCYTALFTVDDIEFTVSAWNLPRQEFLKVVESIIE